MPITPDTKDWTWVIDRPCPDCGFDSSSVPAEQVASGIRDNAAVWQRLLQDEELPRLTTRPSDDQWSALEYACHVRDVFRRCDGRFHLMLDQDDPTFANWDQDVTAIEDRYNTQDPATVLAELVEAADTLANTLDAVSKSGWSRTGRRSDGARFTISSFARYVLHDPVHHVWDVEQGLATLDRGR